MKKLICTVVFIILILTSCSAYEDFDAAVFAEKLTSSEYMGRQAGTQGAQAASSLICEEFKKIGMQPRKSDFTATVSLPQSFEALLEINGQACTYMQDFVPARASSNTDITASVTFDINDENISEKIWVTTKGFPGIENAGKLPCGILVCDEILRYVHAVNTNIPVFCITEEIYSLLAENTEKSVRMSLKSEIKEQTLTNIIAAIPGKNSDSAIVVSAHYDGCGFDESGIYQSAVDNASGVTVMLEAAQMLVKSDITPEKDIVFVAFDGEETGLYGSANYTYQMLYKDVFNINIDCIEKNKNISIQTNEITPEAEALADSLNCSVTELCGLSDNMSFSFMGHDAVLVTSLTKEDSGFIHTLKDTYDMLDFYKIKNTANGICEYILENAA